MYERLLGRQENSKGMLRWFAASLLYIKEYEIISFAKHPSHKIP